jgi:hypothetical protein
MDSMAYFLAAVAFAFGLASCVGVLVVLRKIIESMAEAAGDPDRIRRAATLPIGYRIFGAVSFITLVTSIVAFGNSGGVPWLAPFKGVTIVVAVVSAACLLVFLRLRRKHG